MIHNRNMFTDIDPLLRLQTDLVDPMNDRAFGKSENLVPERVQRNHSIVGGMFAVVENGGDAVEDRLARIGNGARSEFGHDDSFRRLVLFVNVRSEEAALVSDGSVFDSEPVD